MKKWRIFLTLTIWSKKMSLSKSPKILLPKWTSRKNDSLDFLILRVVGSIRRFAQDFLSRTSRLDDFPSPF